jgi:hypothetical protein
MDFKIHLETTFTIGNQICLSDKVHEPLQGPKSYYIEENICQETSNKSQQEST